MMDCWEDEQMFDVDIILFVLICPSYALVNILKKYFFISFDNHYELIIKVKKVIFKFPQ